MRLTRAWASRLALAIAVGLVVALLVGPAVARNVQATRLLRALPCTTDRPACLTELVALHPIESGAEEPGGPPALALGGTDGLLVALDGAGGRPDGWAPRQATLAIDFQREPSEWSDPGARYL